MRQNFIFCLLVILLSAFHTDKNHPYPEDYFRSPVTTTLRLSGTFGELRSNHFHSGIDIKGFVGQPLLATAEGYVARIKVQAGGYGKALYLRHPNGYTTVYAHMDQFTPALENYVKSIQYEKESFEVDIFPEAGRFAFAKGDKIGEMGVTGRSFGPHLHFEVRDTRTEKPINPLLFGFDVADTQLPRLHQLRVYSLDPELRTQQAKTFSLVPRGNGYGVKGDTLRIGAWRAGFALKTYDHMDGVSNWNGIYSLSMYVDDSLTYEFEMEQFAFDESRYINAHLDYEEQVAHKSYFNRLYRLPGNRLSIYTRQVEEGVVTLRRNRPARITMISRDAAGNSSTLEFWVRRDEVEPISEKPVYHYFLPHDEENVIDNASVFMRFPKGTLYEDLYLFFQAAADASSDIYSPVYHIHDYKTPVHRYFELAIRPDRLPAELREKAFVAYCDQNNEVVSYGGEWKNGFLHTKVRDLGDFCIMVDTQPPFIEPKSFANNMKGWNRMTFLVGDKVATAGNVPGLRYRATIDGQWILLTYDAKNDLLTHDFDQRFSSGEHQLRLTVTDGQGNQSTFERTISL